MVKAIPDGHHTITPYLRIRDAGKAIDFYKRAFSAEELVRMPGPDGKIMHAQIKIGDSIVMMSEECAQYGSVGPQTLNGTSVGIHVYSKDVDATVAQAAAAGAKVKMPPADMFWGDRFAVVIDPFGHEWSVATHKEDLTPEQIAKRQAEFFANIGGKK